jgi:hypothetical protein
MRNSDPTTPDGLRFVFAAEADPIEGDAPPCVWCNHPDILPERKAAMADGTDREAADIPDSEAMCRADYAFVVGDRDGEGVEIPVCEGCLYDLPIEYGDSDAQDLPFAWQDEVVLKTEVPRLDASTGHVHRGVPVKALADFDANFSAGD